MARGKKTGGRDWKPGESGNPNGRPKSENARSEILRELSPVVDADQELSNAEIIANKVIELAKQGVQWAVREYYDRTDGKPHQSVDVTSNIKMPDVVGFYPEDYGSSTTEDPDTDPE